MLARGEVREEHCRAVRPATRWLTSEPRRARAAASARPARGLMWVHRPS
jgi:hypothetical protein